MAYVSVTPYADLTYANAYMADRVRTEAWDEATDSVKTKALKQATRAIDRLNFAGDKADEAQARQFPRGNDTEVPDDVIQACCELALAFLDDVDPNIEIENLNRTRQGIGDARIEKDTSYVQDHVRSGIPSIQAWMLLVPYLRDPGILDMDRG